MDEQGAREDRGCDREGIDAGIEHSEAAGFPHPQLARVPFAHVLVPADLHRRDSLAGERLRRRRDRRVMARVPGRVERHPLHFGEAGEVVDLGQCGGRRLLEQAVETLEDAGAGDFVARPGGVVIATASKPSTLSISARQSVNFCPAPWPVRLELATRSKRGLPAIEGKCWSAAILPKPRMAILIGFTLSSLGRTRGPWRRSPRVTGPPCRGRRQGRSRSRRPPATAACCRAGCRRRRASEPGAEAPPSAP